MLCGPDVESGWPPLLQHSPSLCRQSTNCSEMLLYESGGAQGWYCVAVAMHYAIVLQTGDDDAHDSV